MDYLRSNWIAAGVRLVTSLEIFCPPPAPYDQMKSTNVEVRSSPRDARLHPFSFLFAPFHYFRWRAEIFFRTVTVPKTNATVRHGDLQLRPVLVAERAAEAGWRGAEHFKAAAVFLHISCLVPGRHSSKEKENQEPTGPGGRAALERPRPALLNLIATTGIIPLTGGK